MRDVERGVLSDGNCMFSNNPNDAVRDSAFTITNHSLQHRFPIPLFIISDDELLT